MLFGRLKNGGVAHVVVVADETGARTLGFVYPEGPVLPRPERDIIEAGKKRSPTDVEARREQVGEDEPEKFTETDGVEAGAEPSGAPDAPPRD